MLMLCSNGLTNETLLNEVRKYIKSDQRAAIVVTADNEYKEQNYHVPRVMSELQSIGLKVECFDIDVQDVKLLLSYDVVEFIGGNPYYLLNSLRKTNAKPILKELAEQKVLIGWSAGALVMCKSLDLINVYSPEMNFLHMTDLQGMNLTDTYILPHYNKFLKRYDRFEERCQNFEQMNNCKVIRLNDGEGIVL